MRIQGILVCLTFYKASGLSLRANLPFFLCGSRALSIVVLLVCTCAQHLLDDRIERTASRTLDTEEMPLTTMTPCFAVVAHNVDHSLQIGWHGMFRNITRPCFPCRRHAGLTDDSFLTDRASIIETGKFPEAMRVYGMATWQILRRLPR